MGRGNTDDGQRHQPFSVIVACLGGNVVGPQRHCAIKDAGNARRAVRPCHVIDAENEPALQNQQQHVKGRKETEHRERGRQVRRDHRVHRPFRMAEVQHQRRRDENHAAQRGQQCEPGNRLEPLYAKRMVHAGNSKGACDQSSQIWIDRDQQRPRYDCLVWINVARVRCNVQRNHHVTSLSMPT